MNLNDLIKRLKDDGYPDEMIVDITEAVSRMALLKITNDITAFLASLPEEDQKIIEDITEETERNKKISEYYQQKNGKTTDQMVKETLDFVASEYLKERDLVISEEEKAEKTSGNS